MELLIGIACITVTIYYLYLMAGLMDIRAERKRLDRQRRRRWIRKNMITVFNVDVIWHIEMMEMTPVVGV